MITINGSVASSAKVFAETIDSGAICSTMGAAGAAAPGGHRFMVLTAAAALNAFAAAEHFH